MNTRARIATICQNRTRLGTVEENREYVLSLLDQAMATGPDLVCLPETFTTVGIESGSPELAETVPGPSTDACAKRAKEAGSYVVCPIRTVRDGAHWNSAVVIGRDGSIVGIYDKAHPVTSSEDYTSMERGIRPGTDRPPVFDLDFGRVGIQICFDAGFPETWQALADQGARLVLWPSAYNGGFPLRAYAYIHHYFVVTSVQTAGARIIDPLGTVRAATDECLHMVYSDVNLDFAVAHWDFNLPVPAAILEQYGARVSVLSDRDSAHFLVEPQDPKITIEALKREIGFESTDQYHARHRSAYSELRSGRAAPPQAAAHANRAQHSEVSE